MSHDLTKKRIAVIDFETDPFLYGRYPKPFAVGFYDGSAYESRWGEAKDIVKWAVNRCSLFSGYVYAHNGGKFDFVAFLLGGTGKKLWGEPVFCIAGRIVRMKLGECELRDSYAILPSPLASHDKGEIDYAKFERKNRERHKPEILDYLKRDCQSLHSLVLRFLEDHGLRSLTAASAAMAAAKKLGLTAEEMSESKDAYLRKWYFGGLVLARKPGIHRGDFRLYDIKSAYPYAMLHDHPASADFDMLEKGEIEGRDFLCVEGSGTVFMRKNKDKTTWGGSGIFLVTGWEWLASQETGTFRGRVKFILKANQTVNFRSYVEEYFAKKEECERTGDKAGRLVNKIMLNALYGKFAQKPDRFKDFFIMPLSEPLAEGFTMEAEFDDCGLCVWSKPSTGGRFYNVACAASITGFVRAMLIQAIHETDAYYCDTDSLLCDSAKTPSGLRNSLGGWNLEAEGDMFCLAGKKLYALRLKEKVLYKEREWKTATKGCRLTPEQVQKLIRGETIQYHNDAPTFSLLNAPHFVKRKIRATAPELAANLQNKG